MQEQQKGVLSIKYHEGRERKRALKYRLARRTDEVLNAINGYKSDIVSLGHRNRGWSYA